LAFKIVYSENRFLMSRKQDSSNKPGALVVHETCFVNPYQKRRKNMFSTKFNQRSEVVDLTTLPIAIEPQSDPRLNKWLVALSPDKSWGERKLAAERLGYLGNPQAVPGLLEALPADPFWMVRCAMIQALDKIGDPRALPTLRDVAKRDRFQVVRSYAARAIERLSQQGIDSIRLPTN